MNELKLKIFICNFTKTISSAILTAIAINIIMMNATAYALFEGAIPLVICISIVSIIDIYQYRYEKEEKITIDDLDKRIQKLESNTDG